MALLTKSEFASLLGIATTSIPAYRSRRKIVVREDGFVDTEHEINKAFYLYMSAKKANRNESEVISNPKPDIKEGIKKRVSKRIDDSEEDSDDSGIPSYATSEKMLKYLDTQKREQEIELLKLKTQKTKGEVVPTELVAPILQQQNQSMMVELKNGMDEILRDIAKKFDLSVDQVACYRGEVTNKINESANQAIIFTKKSLEIIIQDFADKRGVGERN